MRQINHRSSIAMEFLQTRPCLQISGTLDQLAYDRARGVDKRFESLLTQLQYSPVLVYILLWSSFKGRHIGLVTSMNSDWLFVETPWEIIYDVVLIVAFASSNRRKKAQLKFKLFLSGHRPRLKIRNLT